LILVEHLTRRFGSTTAVDDISFRVERGDVCGFLGPNGAGKTTTMRMLTGFLPATSGRIEICGLDVLRRSLDARRRIGYLPESVPFYREHRVEELCWLQARLHRLPRKTARARTDEVLERVQIAERRRSLFGKLSKGLRQRVGLALALLHDPEVLILDEPTSGLDPLQRVGVRDLIRELAEDRTVLISSHILPEIEAVCPRVVILNEGRIAASGTPDELVREHARASHVRVEVACGPDVDACVRTLGAIDGVAAVEDDGWLGVHRVLRLLTHDDLREDVGAICAAKAWALRELSWQRPTLEAIFTRIALGLDEEPRAERPPAHPASPDEAPSPEEPGGPGDGLLPLAGATTPAPDADAKASGPTLNPFDPPAGQAKPKVKPKPSAPASGPDSETKQDD